MGKLHAAQMLADQVREIYLDQPSHSTVLDEAAPSFMFLPKCAVAFPRSAGSMSTSATARGKLSPSPSPRSPLYPRLFRHRAAQSDGVVLAC